MTPDTAITIEHRSTFDDRIVRTRWADDSLEAERIAAEYRIAGASFVGVFDGGSLGTYRIAAHWKFIELRDPRVAAH